MNTERTTARAAAPPVSETAGIPTVSQMSHDEDATATSHQDMADETIAFTETEKSTFADVDTALNCYFHVMQNFSNRKSFVGDFKDKSHCFSKKGGLAHKHAQMIHHCKTIAVRLTAMRLVLRHWREVWGQEAAAKKFEEQHCSFPHWNWSYSATGEVGALASNCPNGSLNKLLKQGIRMNVSLPRFLVQTLPKLLWEDANVRGDPCRVEYPRDCSSVGLSNKDFVTCEDRDGAVEGYLFNLRYMIGVPFTEERLRIIAASWNGADNSFVNDNDGALPGDIAKRIVDVAKTTCHVAKNLDGVWIGDCEDCCKRLGHDCPGALWVRSDTISLTSHLKKRERFQWTRMVTQ